MSTTTKLHPQVAAKFNSYPEAISNKLFMLRELIYETASEHDDIETPEETLKWGQPSYVARNGSTVRIDSNLKTPEKYYLYFHCQTKLVSTFKQLYADRFQFDGKRAIVFNVDDEIQATELKHCISMALRYHLVKDLPLLGA